MTLKIVSAIYGMGDPSESFVGCDVSETLQKLVDDSVLDLAVSNSALGLSDPFPGHKKWLRVRYQIGDVINEVLRYEKDRLILGSKGPIAVATLRDRLIRKFNITDRRLRGPMPVELSNFNRNDLARIFAELGFTKGAEVGVAEGHYSEILCKSIPNLELMCVDPWTKYSENPRAHSTAHQEFSKKETERRLRGYNATLEQALSMEAVQLVAPKSLDFVYIDGHHGFDYVMQDLIEWSKRVRSGGIVAGDDYYYFKWAGVVEAVQAYVKAHEIDLWFLIQAPRSVDFFWVNP
jgi:hypothetical protein